jgi:hypothetical protein
MALTVEEIYKAASPLPASEKLQLVRRLLSDIPSESIVDYSEEWSKEDIREATLHSLRYADSSLGEEPQDI